MPAKKIRDLAVKVSEYQDQQGNNKGRWENIGSLMQGDDGGLFVILKRTFNPAGVPNPEGRDSVIVSAFEDRNGQGGGQPQGGYPQQGGYPPQGGQQAPQQGGGFGNDTIPF